MQTSYILNKPITESQFKRFEEVIVLDELNDDGYAKTYFFDESTQKTYIKRDFIKNMRGRRASAVNFSNKEINIKDAIDSINWAISKNSKVVGCE